MESKITLAAFNLFLKYGVRSVSLDDISREIGISKKTIYEYFENKKELVDKSIRYYIAKEMKDVCEISENAQNSIDEMMGIARYILSFLREMSASLVYDLRKYYPDSWNFIESEHIKFIQDQIKNNILRGKEDGFYKENINVDVISRLYVAQSRTITDEDIFPTKQFAKAALFQEFIIYHMYGIVSDKGRKYIQKIQLND